MKEEEMIPEKKMRELVMGACVDYKNAWIYEAEGEFTSCLYGFMDGIYTLFISIEMNNENVVGLRHEDTLSINITKLIKDISKWQEEMKE